MRIFFGNLILQMGKIPCGNVMNILAKLQNIVNFVKTEFSVPNGTFCTCTVFIFITSCLRTFIYSRSVQDTHMQVSFTESVYKLNNVLEEIVSSQFYS